MSSKTKIGKKKVFVTVGTTNFDTLIKKVSSDQICEILKQRGFTEVVLQIGNGSFTPNPKKEQDFHLSFFRLKDSISEEVQSADLIISHAGAGSVLESLEAGKKLIVVINEELMGNHQTELAREMSNQGFLYFSNIERLHEVLKDSDFTKLKTYTKGNPKEFSACLDKIMGFS